MRKQVKILWLIGIAYLLFIGIGYIAHNLVTSKQFTKTKYILKEEIKPSYDYLKSVTVIIYGIGKLPSEEFKGSLIRLKSKYYIISENLNIIKWLGTGVIIKIKNGYTYILTNAHIAGKKLTNVTLFVENDDKNYEAEVVQCHKILDIAVIKFKGKLKGKQVIKGIAVAKPQDKVYCVGHHLGVPYIYGEGVFAGYVGFYDKIQIPCMWGNSGSGIFDKEGNLVALVFGINYQTIFDSPVFDVAHAIAIDSISIKLFLNKINELK